MIKFALTFIGVIALAFVFNLCELCSEVADWINEVEWEEIL